MSETWQEGYRAAMLQFLQTEVFDTVVEIRNFEERYESDNGGCDTCGTWDEYYVDFDYINEHGQYKSYTYTGTFASVMYQILKD